MKKKFWGLMALAVMLIAALVTACPTEADDDDDDDDDDVVLVPTGLSGVFAQDDVADGTDPATYTITITGTATRDCTCYISFAGGIGSGAVDEGDDADAVATKIADALSADTTFTDDFAAAASGAVVTITADDPAVSFNGLTGSVSFN